MGKLKIHPLPDGANEQLAAVIIPLIDGGIRNFLNAHGDKYDRQMRGLLKGSLRKRILNQMLSEESRLRDALIGDGSSPPRQDARA